MYVFSQFARPSFQSFSFYVQVDFTILLLSFRAIQRDYTNQSLQVKALGNQVDQQIGNTQALRIRSSSFRADPFPYQSTFHFTYFVLGFTAYSATCSLSPNFACKQNIIYVQIGAYSIQPQINQQNQSHQQQSSLVCIQKQCPTIILCDRNYLLYSSASLSRLQSCNQYFKFPVKQSFIVQSLRLKLDASQQNLNLQQRQENKRMDCVKTFFFCCDWQTDNQNQRNAQRRVTRQSAPRTPKKKPSQSRPKRLVTKFRLEQVKLIQDQERKAGFKPIYACPLCFQYYNKILACAQCSNFICLNCFIKLDSTSRKRKQLMKCSFCYSTTSDFIDHQKQGHSYWDTTNKGKGFLTKQQRDQIDKQLNKPANKSILKAEQANLAQIQQQHNDNDHQNEQSHHNIIARQPLQQQVQEAIENQHQQQEDERQDPFVNVQVRSQFENQQSNINRQNRPSIIQMESFNQQNSA